MAKSSRPKASTSSTDPESLVNPNNTAFRNSFAEDQQTTKPINKKAKQRRHSRYPTIKFVSLIFLFLAAAAGITFSVLAVIVFHLRVNGDVPSRILVFAASVTSIVYAGVHVVAARKRYTKSKVAAHFVYGGNSGIQTSALLLSRLVLVAWLASVVLTSLLLTQIGVSLNATLADQAIYLNLLLAAIALIASITLTICIETSRTPFKTAVVSQRSFLRSETTGDDDDAFGDVTGKMEEDDDDLLDRSVSQRGSLDKPYYPATVEAWEPAADVGDEATASAEQRPTKKLLFSYKATTQFIEEKKPAENSVEESEDRGSRSLESRDKAKLEREAAPDSVPEEPVTTVSHITSSAPAAIKRKPIQPPAPAPRRADRRKSVAIGLHSALSSSESLTESKSSSHRVTKSRRPSLAGHDIRPASRSSSTYSSSTASSTTSKQNSRSKRLSYAVAEKDASTFYLSSSDTGSSGSSNSVSNESLESLDSAVDVSDKSSAAVTAAAPLTLAIPSTSRFSTPHSPAVSRPLSIVPPIPAVPSPATTRRLSAGSRSAAAAASKPRSSSIKRKPVGAAGGSIKRKPVPRLKPKSVLFSETVLVMGQEPLADKSAEPVDSGASLSPKSQLPVSTDDPEEASIQQKRNDMPATVFSPEPSSPSEYLSSRKSSVASVSSTESSKSQSLVEMVNSLRRESFAFPAPPSAAALPSSYSTAPTYTSTSTSASASASSALDFLVPTFEPMTTRSVIFANPMYVAPDQSSTIVRKSFIATTGSGNSSRRPSEVSIMETIYSPAEGEEDELVESERRESALSAAIEAQTTSAPMVTKTTITSSSTSFTSRPERKTSVSKAPNLSPVVESPVVGPENNNSDGENMTAAAAAATSSLHTIVVHEPATTYAGLSRTARRMRKAALKAMAAAAVASAAAASSPSSVTYTPAYIRRGGAPHYNFSRPTKRAASVSGAAGFGLVAGDNLPAGSGVLGQRALIRRQLLQMLPAQHQVVFSPRRTLSLSGRRHRRSLSLDLSGLRAGNGTSGSGNANGDDDWEDEDDEDTESEEELRSQRRSLSLARKAARAYRRNHHGANHGLGGTGTNTNTRRDHRHVSRASPHTRPISPMTLLMERSLR